MAYVRGHRGDYDRWASSGLSGAVEDLVDIVGGASEHGWKVRSVSEQRPELHSGSDIEHHRQPRIERSTSWKTRSPHLPAHKSPRLRRCGCAAEQRDELVALHFLDLMRKALASRCLPRPRPHPPGAWPHHFLSVFTADAGVVHPRLLRRQLFANAAIAAFARRLAPWAEMPRRNRMAASQASA